MFKLAIAGRYRRGKDTLADTVARLAPNPTTKIAFADALKEELADLIWESGDVPTLALNKGIRDGNLLAFREWMRSQRDVNGVGWQWWGEFRRKFYDEDYWINHAYFTHNVYDATSLGHNIIIPDMRHHNESAWAAANGFYRVRIAGPCRSEDNRDPNHPSERDVDALEVDDTFWNSGGIYRVEAWVQNVLLPRLTRVPEPVQVPHDYNLDRWPAD